MNRRTDEILMPLAEVSSVIHPEAALLVWPNFRRKLDIGQLCYRKRSTSHRKRVHHSFDAASFSKERATAVRKLITQFSERTRLGGLRPATVLYAGRTLVRFVNWADREGLQDVLRDQGSAAEGVTAFFLMLRERVSQSNRNRNAVATEQRVLLSELREFFEDDGFGAGARTMRIQKSDTVPTKVPDAEAQALLIAWADAVFGGLSSLVLEFAPYPVAITSAHGETVQIVPHTYSRQAGETSFGLHAWDFVTGENRTYKELVKRFTASGHKSPRQKASAVARTAARQLCEANLNRHAEIRRRHATTASYAFAALFLTETGMNLAQLLDLKWNAELEVSLQSPSVTRQKFRQVKYRAGGKEIAFKVSVGFMPKLKTYMALRKYLVGESHTEEFFVIARSDGRPTAISEQFLNSFYRRFDSLGIVLPRVNAREWRAAKQDWAVSNHGPVVAAMLMGHSLETAIRVYSNGSAAAQQAEFSAFLTTVEGIVLRPNENPPGSIKNAVGVCVEFQKPLPITAVASVKPDCRSSEGCLFCDKYKVHADATDVRKLLSCRHCVRLVCNRTDSMEQYDNSFGIVLRRLSFLLDELRKRDADLVAEIENDVDIEGNLDRFWASKLDQLLELGLA
jgi:hypothetical protein